MEVEVEGLRKGYEGRLGTERDWREDGRGAGKI